MPNHSNNNKASEREKSDQEQRPPTQRLWKCGEPSCLLLFYEIAYEKEKPRNSPQNAAEDQIQAALDTLQRDTGSDK